MYTKNHITALTADKYKMQFSQLCDLSSETLRQQFQDFSRSKDRLDKFYYKVYT